MKHFTCLLLLVAVACVSEAHAQRVTRDIPYATAHERQVLDVHAPAGAKNLPVVFWIHGGGWQTGDKSMVALKPKAFMDAGFVFVSINHRLLPTVDMGAITRDVASALGWVHKNIATHGGDPARLLVMGHSSGGQLAALMCTDDRYAKAEGFSLTTIKGCVPVDADTFDIPAIIEMAETRARVHHLPLPTYGHRQKFGNDPAKHRDFSAVTHVARNKGIPPFLILHIAGHPDTGAQARRLAGVLEAAGISAKVVAGRETTHASINDNIGAPNDPVTKELFAFVAEALKRSRLFGAALSHPVMNAPGERSKKRHEILLVARREIQPADLAIETGVRPAAAVVELDHGFERGKAAVVHIRRGAGDLAQCWRLEGPAIGW